jgi:hypothetical protein
MAGIGLSSIGVKSLSLLAWPPIPVTYLKPGVHGTLWRHTLNDSQKVGTRST